MSEDAARERLERRQAIRSREALLRDIEQEAERPIERLGQTLIGLGLITESDLAAALAAQRGQRDCPVGQLLIRQGRITPDQLETALNLKLGFAVVDVERFEVEAAALAKVPWTLVRRLRALPLLVEAGQLVVAMGDPKRQDHVDELSWASGCWVRPVLADAAALERRIAAGPQGRPVRGAGPLAASSGDGGRWSTPSGSLEMAEQAIRAVSSAAAATQGPVDGGAGLPSSAADPIALAAPEDEHALVRLINQVLEDARAAGASDIHLESQADGLPVRLRFRCDGRLQTYLELPHAMHAPMVARLKVMAALDTSERRRPQDGRIRLSRPQLGPALDLRVVTVPTRDGQEDVVLRLLATTDPVPLEQLDFNPTALQRLHRAIDRPHGLILCAGPTGSGKTTTLHAALARLNTPQRKIWTAEDPIEIVQPGLRQVQVQPRLDWTFGKALRAFLRADPDVIMVGEIRDRETAQVAVDAALTGHLVLSTIHTNSAAETVARLLDMGVDPFHFSDTLLAVVGQRLVRRRCTDCAISRPAQEADIQAWRAEWALHGTSLEGQHGMEAMVPPGPLKAWTSPGCPACQGTGLRGRLGVQEVLTVDRAMRGLIQGRASAEDLHAHAVEGGMLPLRQDGLVKVIQGLTTLEEVRASCGE